MSGSYISGTGRRQLLLLPDMIENYIEEDNPARFMDSFVDSMDLGKFGFKFSTLKEGAGRPSYDPKDILKLYLWGYFNGIRSSRKLEKECHRNMEVMWLLCRLTPDFKTIADFRKDNIDCMKKVFMAFNKMCMEQDLFGRKTVAIDGTKVKAWNARDKTYTKDNVDKRIKEMDEKVDSYLKEIEENDGKEEDEPKITNMKEKIETMKKRMDELKEIQKKMEQTDTNEISLTDPEARLMKTRTGIDVCYNAQISVDDKYHLIVDYDLDNDPTDCSSMVPMSEKSREILEADNLEALADKGYFSGENIKTLHDKGIDAFISEPKHGTSDAEKLVAFAGIDPVIKESGKQRSQKSISKRGDSSLRSAIYQSTLAAIRGNPVISEFYRRKVDGGMPKKKALVAASRKQCHIIWSVWHNNKPFEVPEKFRKQE